MPCSFSRPPRLCRTVRFYPIMSPQKKQGKTPRLPLLFCSYVLVSIRALSALPHTRHTSPSCRKECAAFALPARISFMRLRYRRALALPSEICIDAMRTPSSGACFAVGRMAAHRGRPPHAMRKHNTGFPFGSAPPFRDGAMFRYLVTSVRSTSAWENSFIHASEKLSPIFS